MHEFNALAAQLLDAFREISATGAYLEHSPDAAGLIASAVLIPLIVRPDRASILLTRRSEQLRHHAGQISFPGGRMEAEDASVELAALRETHEEIGIHPCDVVVLGRLPALRVPSGFAIHPVFGLLRPSVQVRPDPVEVAGAFDVPLDHLVAEQNYQKHRIVRPGGAFQADAIAYQGYFIWGATAAILVRARPYLETVLRRARI